MISKSVQIIFIYIAIHHKTSGIYIPVLRVTGVDHHYGVTGIKLSDLIGFIIAHGRAKCQITLGYTDRFGSECTAAYQVVFVHETILIIFRRIYIPVLGITGLQKLDYISGVKLSNLIGGIISLHIAKCQVALGYADHSGLTEIAGSPIHIFIRIQIFLIYKAIAVQLR